MGTHDEVASPFIKFSPRVSENFSSLKYTHKKQKYMTELSEYFHLYYVR